MNETKAIHTVGLLYKASSPEANALCTELSDFLEAKGIGTRSLNETQPGIAKESLEDLDLVIILGGDGTLIHTVKLLAGLSIPLLGINMGTLGFLTEINRDEAQEVLDQVLSGDYRVTSRHLLRAELFRDGAKEPLVTGDVLNDVVLSKSVLARLILVDAYANGEFVSRYRGDGLIVSTPTGSTAYNLAANGPILLPTMNAMVLSPICPHSFANRPVVIPNDTILTLRLVDPPDDVFLTLDGQAGCELQAGDEVTVRLSNHLANVVRHPQRSYYELLHHKLGWGVH